MAANPQREIRNRNALPGVSCAATGEYGDGMKFGRIKRQHGRVGGLDAILDRIVSQCPHVTRIVPGRIKVRRGKTPPSFKVQYPTDAGLKCLYTGTGTVQEVFLICSSATAAQQWLEEAGIITVER
jgi:methyl coenzyme M reductase beta subunit